MMTKSLLIVLALAGFSTCPAVAQEVSVDRGVIAARSRAATRGATTNFTGEVSVRPVIDASQMGNTSLGEVSFLPGARSNWHTHPGGQALYILQGCGWTQREDGPIIKICKGDTAYVPAGVKHWHGATATSGMTHLAITEMVDGKNVTWMEPVTGPQFAAGTRDAP